MIRCFGCKQEEYIQEQKKQDTKLKRWLKEERKRDLSTLKILLLGTGESGKSTITKQMRIIHNNGFDDKNKRENIPQINKNILESIVSIVSAMNDLGIRFENTECEASAGYIKAIAANREPMDFRNVPQEFYDHVMRLWDDSGVQDCFSRSNEYQLIDCAQYFLDRLREIRKLDYLPSEQDILRCRLMTTGINQIDYTVRDGRNNVNFSVYDVGGQQGERRRWIQVFECVTAILYLADCSSFDQTLREDNKTNRLVDSLHIFEQVWNNRFLRYVSVLLFVNKIDRLKEKIDRGRTVRPMLERYYQELRGEIEIDDKERFTRRKSSLPRLWDKLNFDTFQPSENERRVFLNSYPGASPSTSRKRSKGSINPNEERRSVEISPNVIKNASFIMRTFMDLTSIPKLTEDGHEDFHQHHTCNCYYTCAVNTNNIQIVLDGCRSLIITKHLERFGIL
ncbi:guanine nucleotide-binding protein G(olf) subunit alpha-like isoform X2 [Tubulanus polymorphus]